MTHDQKNERNEKWLRSVIEGLEAQNSSAEAIAQKLYEFAWRKHEQAGTQQSDNDG